MKALILGGSGMLGHKLWQTLGNSIEVVCTLRTSQANKKLEQLRTPNRRIEYGLHAENIDSIERILQIEKPDVLINCIGIIKQLELSKNFIQSIQLNSLLPHQLNKICTNYGIRFIHISTDCVFDGKKGNYKEDDISDAEDLYGKSKYLGEVVYDNALTIRTSIVGHELESSISLFDWFLSQTGTIKGYSKVMYSGLTTLELSNVILDIVLNHKMMNGLYQISSNPISKYDLLNILKIVYEKNIQVEAYDNYESNKVLNGSKFNELTGYHVPSWEEMIASLRKDYLTNDFLYKKHK